MFFIGQKYKIIFNKKLSFNKKFYLSLAYLISIRPLFEKKLLSNCMASVESLFLDCLYSATLYLIFLCFSTIKKTI